MNAVTSLLHKNTELLPEEKIEVGHVEFAEVVLADRRSAMGLTFEQTRQMASAILVLDHQRHDLEQKLVTMMARFQEDYEAQPVEAQPQPIEERPQKTVTKTILKEVYIPVAVGKNEGFNVRLQALVTAYARFQKEKFGHGENMARQEMEKAATDLAKFSTPKNKGKNS